MLGCEGGEALAQVAQRSCGGFPSPGNVQGQLGWGLDQPGLVEGVAAHGREWAWMGFKVPSQTIPGFLILFSHQESHGPYVHPGLSRALLHLGRLA